MSEQDPFALLGTQLNEDAKAERKTAARKGEPDRTDEAAAEQARVEAERPATNVPVETDAETVFDRRMERFMTIVEEARFEAGNAFGILRDTILDLFKHRPSTWQGMDNQAQRDTIRAIEDASKDIIGKLVLVIAQEDCPTIHATMLDKLAVNGEAVEVKLKIEHVNADVLLDVYKMAGQRVVIVSADDRRFMGAKTAPKTDPDQPDLPIEVNIADAIVTDAKINAVQMHPIAMTIDDAALADGDDTPSGVDVAIGEAIYAGVYKNAGDPALTHGVFDEMTTEWLAIIKEPPSEDDDVWTPDASQAKRMTKAEAERIAEQVGDPNISAAPLDAG